MYFFAAWQLQCEGPHSRRNGRLDECDALRSRPRLLGDASRTRYFLGRSIAPLSAIGLSWRRLRAAREMLMDCRSRDYILWNYRLSACRSSQGIRAGLIPMLDGHNYLEAVGRSETYEGEFARISSWKSLGKAGARAQGLSIAEAVVAPIGVAAARRRSGIGLASPIRRTSLVPFDADDRCRFPPFLANAIRSGEVFAHADSPSRSACHRPHRRGRGDRAAGGGDQGTGRERARRRGEDDRGRDRGRRAKAHPRRRRRAGHGRSGSRA